MTRYIYLVVIAYLCLIILIELHKSGIFKITGLLRPLGRALEKGLVSTKKSLGRKTGRMYKHFDNMSISDRRKSKLYKYLSSMSAIITSLNLQAYTNPESLFFFIVLTSFVIAIAMTIGLVVQIKVVTFLAVIIMEHSFLFFISRSEMTKRMLATMDALDSLSSHIEDGILQAVKECLPSMDARVRPVFEDFNLKTGSLTLSSSIEKPWLELNMKLGSISDVFCENALIFNSDNDPALLKSFKDGILENSARNIKIMERETNYKQALFMYAIAISICLVFGLVFSFVMGVGLSYFSTVHGRIATIASLIVAFFGFVVGQIIYSGRIE